MTNPGELFMSTIFLAAFAAAMSAVVDAGMRRAPVATARAGQADAPEAADPVRKTQAQAFLRADSPPRLAAQTGATPMKDRP